MNWCPFPDCEYVVKVLHLPHIRPVTCKCGNEFCFGCGAEAHEPIRCDMLKRWAKKCQDDSETSNWLNANTKVGNFSLGHNNA